MRTVVVTLLLFMAACTKLPKDEVIAAPAIINEDTVTVTQDTTARKF